MKQVVQYVNTKELKVEDVPPPGLRSGGVLVANRFSLVSVGTEKMTIDMAKKSLVGKALERPDLVKQVLHRMKTEGFATTLEKVKTRLEAPIALGYSCAGTVVAVSEDVDDFQVGDRVACAGQGYASHADVVFVPRNLCVKVPDDVGLDEAAYVTLGAIAMQGVRVADVTLGENVLVIGLGLLGQLAVQILRSAGCRVLGVDIDPAKTELARKLGADAVAVRGRDSVTDIAASLSRGRGIDAAVITAATSSNDPIELAAEALREKGRVSVVGAVKMDIPRKPYYEKELDIRLSRSYGPGRYDPTYEERGVDYPLGYVRWTERRNMESFLDLVAAKRVDTRQLTTHTFDIADASRAYSMIEGKDAEPFLGVLLKYGEDEARLATSIPVRELEPSNGKVTVGMIGAGSFGQAVLLPHLAKIENATLRAVATVDGLTAKRVAEKAGAAYATGTADDILTDRSIDAVIIATRHDQHAPMTVKALEEGKSVFVEKPLALNPEELEAVSAAHAKSGREVVVDFNRRLSPLTQTIKSALRSRTRPLTMCYRVNGGFVPKSSWVQDPVEGGGRILGEVCHFVDLLQYICGGAPTDVHAVVAFNDNEERVNKDNFIAMLSFSDGSVGSIAYVADGNPKMPKERIEIFGEGASFVIDDFKSATIYKGGKVETTALKSQDKGHGAMLRSFIDMAAGQAGSPVPFEEAVRATRATFAILESLGLGMSVKVIA